MRSERDRPPRPGRNWLTIWVLSRQPNLGSDRREVRRYRGHCDAADPQCQRTTTGARLIVLLSTSDTDLLSGRASGADYRLANPSRLAVEDLPALLDGARAVVVRILGGRLAWADGLDAVAASGVPSIVLGGEVTPDAELMQLSCVAGGVVAEAHAYLAYGGPDNL